MLINALWREQKSWTFFEDSYNEEMYLSNVMQDVFSIPLSRDPWISCFVSHSNTQVQIITVRTRRSWDSSGCFLIFWLCISPYWKLLCYPGLIMMPFFQEESDTRLAVQEALSMMAPSYKNADSTILALIEALILNYVQQVPSFLQYQQQLIISRANDLTCH